MWMWTYTLLSSALAQVALGGCGVSILRDNKKILEHGPKQPATGSPAGAGVVGLDDFQKSLTTNLNHSYREGSLIRRPNYYLSLPFPSAKPSQLTWKYLQRKKKSVSKPKPMAIEHDSEVGKFSL